MKLMNNATPIVSSPLCFPLIQVDPVLLEHSRPSMSVFYSIKFHGNNSIMVSFCLSDAGHSRHAGGGGWHVCRGEHMAARLSGQEPRCRPGSGVRTFGNRRLRHPARGTRVAAQQLVVSSFRPHISPFSSFGNPRPCS